MKSCAQKSKHLPRTFSCFSSGVMKCCLAVFLLGSIRILFSNDYSSLPNDIRWVRQSGEYKELCKQVFQQAWYQVKKQADLGGKLAVVVDLDETILDNSLYQVDRWGKGLGFTQESWSEWVNQKEAGLVPGAKVFLDKARNIGVTVVFMSNRMHHNLQPTIENLKGLRVWQKEDLFLLRENKQDTKEIRRKEVLEGTGRMKKVGPLKVLAYLGDQIGDFPNKSGEVFGVSQFLLPNPTYGKW
jgi:5'-nucleotidase (lipoprotein e(P4) family)